LQLGKSTVGVNRSQTCKRQNDDFQVVCSPASSPSIRNSYRIASTDDLFRHRQLSGFQDIDEVAFLEMGPKLDPWKTSKLQRDRSSYADDSKAKKKDFIGATMRRIRLCSGFHQSDKSSEGSTHLGDLFLSDKKPRKTRRGESEEESDYAYIDRSTHSITGYLSREAIKKTQSTHHPMSTFMPMVEHQIDDDDPMSPYATTQVLLTNQQLYHEVMLHCISFD
jgi:hypothetical protein